MPRMQKTVHGRRRRSAKASRSLAGYNDGVSGWHWGIYKIYLKLKSLNEIPNIPEPEPVFVWGKDAYVVWFQVDTKKRTRVPIFSKMKLKDYELKGRIECTNI